MFIIHGTIRRVRDAGGGQFLCAACCEWQWYLVKYEVLVFTLFFVPLWEKKVLEEWIECQGCRGRHDREVLGYTPEEILADANPWHCFTCRRKNPKDREHCWHCGVSRYSSSS